MAHGINLTQTSAVTQALPQQTTVPMTQALVVTPITMAGTKTPYTSISERSTHSLATPPTVVTTILRMVGELRNTAGTDRAVFCRLTANGILGKLFATDPRQTLKLCALRLAVLKEDLSSFSDYANMVNGRKTRATEMLVELEQALANTGNAPHKFFDMLNTYENTFNKVSLQTLLDARFMEVPDANAINLLSVTQEGILNPVAEQLQNQLQRSGAERFNDAVMDAESILNGMSMIKVQPGPQLTEARLLEAYIDAFPTAIMEMIIGWIGRAPLNKGNPLNRNQAEQAISMASTPEAIRKILATDEDLRHNLMVDISSMHIDRIYSELKSINVDTASIEELIEARNQCRVFNQLQEQFDDEMSTAEVKKQQTELNPLQIHIQAHMVHLMATAEAKKPADKRLFWLNTPSTEQIAARLSTTELVESPEAHLYKQIISYMDALQNFTATGSHQSLTILQQSRFDLLRSEQSCLVFAMKAQQMGTECDVAGHRDFDADMGLLDDIYACRQATAKFRPILSNTGKIMHLAGQVIWRDELTLNDIKASLIHDQALKQLGYSFKEEFTAVCGGDSSLPVILSTLKQFSSKAQAEISALLSGERSFFQILGLAGSTYSHATQAFSDSLRQILEVAERNPVAFRRMTGDFAQLVPQLKKLVGLGNGEICDLLDQVSWRLSAESTASHFAGTEAVNWQTDLTENPEMAANLKRFQFFCDLASGLLAGTSGLNLIKGALNGPVGFAGALFNIGTMHMAREAVNRMPADQIRLLNNLFQRGPVMGWIARDPSGLMAEAARGLAQHKGIFSAVVNSFMNPFIHRLTPLTEAINNVWNHKPDAWATLAIESAKCIAIVAAGVGVTCIVVAAVGLTGPLGIAGTVFTVIEVAHLAATASYGVARMITYIEDNNIVLRAGQGIDMIRGQLFSENNSVTKKIRLRCEHEAANLVVAMKKQDAYLQQVTSLTAQHLYQNHWDTVLHQQSHEAEVNHYLQQSKDNRIEQAEELLKQVRIMELVAQNIEQARAIAKDSVRLKALRTELNTLGVEFMAPEAGLEYFLLNLKMSAQANLERQCGTTTPGMTQDKIEAYLSNYQREVMLGCVVRETLTEKDSPIVAKVGAEAGAHFYRAVTANIADIEKQRIEMMMIKALEEYIADREAEGDTITAADLQRKDLAKLLAPRVNRDLQQQSTVNTLWMENYKNQLEHLNIMQKMSPESRKNIISSATDAAAPAA